MQNITRAALLLALAAPLAAQDDGFARERRGETAAAKDALCDKRGLYLRALERWGEREIDTKLALLNGEGSPLDNLRTFVRAWAALATTCPVEGCLTIGGILEMRGDADALAVVEGQVARLEGGLSDAIAAARSAGEIREDVVPSRLARSLLASYYGLGVLARLPQSGQLVADAVAAALDQVEAAASR